MIWKDILLVALGGALGAMARFALTALPRTPLPWPTLLANLAGSFAIGAFLLANEPSNSARLWFAVGFLGAFTTLSTYSMETVQLWREHQGLAIGNVMLNAVGGPLLALAGWKLFS